MPFCPGLCLDRQNGQQQVTPAGAKRWHFMAIDCLLKYQILLSDRNGRRAFVIIQEISFSIFPQYQQKLHINVCGEAAFVIAYEISHREIDGALTDQS